MKKCISAMFLCGLMVISLAGCGSGGESTPSADNSLPSSSDGGSTGGTPATEVATPTEPASGSHPDGTRLSPNCQPGLGATRR